MSFAAAIAAAAERQPHSAGIVPVKTSRTLRVDGDGLAYYVAGKDDTPAADARHRLIDKIRSAVSASGAGHVEIVATHASSHKGHRYAVARVKPYQGQRSHSNRPKNWTYLRELFNEGEVGGYPVVQTSTAEADDLFSRHSTEDQVIYTQDKDMRMVPGKHLDWISHLMIDVPQGTYELWHNDKLYGLKWFYLQMLMGDAVDNIPGLPKYREFFLKAPPKEKLIGEKTALKFLEEARGAGEARVLVGDLYRSWYGDRWIVEMMEQAILLWMRNDQDSDPFNVFAPGNPLHPLTRNELYASAHAEIAGRIALAEKYGSTEGLGGSTLPREVVDGPGDALPVVQPAVVAAASSAGPRPLNGSDPISITSLMQRDVGEGGEQLPAIRPAQPRGVLAWGVRLPAKV